MRYTASLDRVYEGDTPSLGLVRKTYGTNTAEAWVEIQLNELSEFAGCKVKLNDSATEQTARMILQSYGHLTVAQLMLFFQKFKRCEYGKFYGAVDPMVIMGALADFSDGVAVEIRRRRREIEKTAAADREQLYDRKFREPYRRRIPGAFTRDAVIPWPLYCVFGLAAWSDGQVARLVADIGQGRKKLPTLVQVMNWSPEQISRFVDQRPDGRTGLHETTTAAAAEPDAKRGRLTHKTDTDDELPVQTEETQHSEPHKPLRPF